MSLVAAVAVAGLTTTSSAKALEEAIKNVDVSGTVVYRYDDQNYDYQTADRGKDASNNKYKIGLTLKSQVNDDVTAVTRFIIGSDKDAGFVGLDYVNGEDAQAQITLSNVYFSYTGLKNTTINFGKQGLTTPWTVAIDADGNEQNGTGILALTNVGPVTLAAAYFNQNNLDESGDLKGTLKAIGTNGVGDNSIWTAGIMGNIGPVALDGWYLDLEDIFDSYTLGANAKFDLDTVKLSLGIRHSEVDFENKIMKTDNSLTKIEAAAKMGIFGAKLAYGWTDDEGGIGALDNDAKTGMNAWNLNLNGVEDATFLKTSIDAQVMPSLNLALNYNILDKDKTSTRSEEKDTELYLQASYQMSKNFGGYIRFGEVELEDAVGSKDNDGTVGRLQVQYSF